MNNLDKANYEIDQSDSVIGIKISTLHLDLLDIMKKLKLNIPL